MENNQTNTRVRMNLSQNAKGLVQFDVTAESESPEESAKLLTEAIKQIRSVCASEGLKLVEAA